MTSTTKTIHAAILSLSLMLPAGGAFAATKHHKKHHYSRTVGTAVGAVAGALIDHKKPLKGALIGGVAGNAVQAVRAKNQ
jgi:hypothetical protein